MRESETLLVSILPMTGLWAMLVVFLEAHTFSSFLSNNIISRTLQILFFGPLVGADALLRYMRDVWNFPIPSTTSGGFPFWLDGLLFLMNWLVYCFLGAFFLLLRAERTKLRG